jgi:catechol 2,3-dioxygenase-like lactoylglutathione lyase family enzyme
VKQRTGDPWKPADRYGRELPAFTVNLIVRDVPRAVGFQTEVLGARVHYADPDFAALNMGGVELMLHADHTYDKHPWSAPLTRGERRGLGAELRVRRRSRRSRAARAGARLQRHPARDEQGARLARGDGGGSRRLPLGRRRTDPPEAGVVSYIDENLLPDEHVVYRAELHWIIFARAILVLVVGLVLVFVPRIGQAGLVVLLLGVVMLVPPFVDYRTTELGVTNKRVIVKTGLVRRRTLELLLRQVEAISVDQSLLGRLLGFGSITLTGTGGVREVFHRVREPLELRRRIHGQVA